MIFQDENRPLGYSALGWDLRPWTVGKIKQDGTNFERQTTFLIDTGANFCTIDFESIKDLEMTVESAPSIESKAGTDFDVTPMYSGLIFKFAVQKDKKKSIISYKPDQFRAGKFA